MAGKALDSRALNPLHAFPFSLYYLVHIEILDSLSSRVCEGILSAPAFSWHWWYVVMAIAAAVALAVLLAVYVTRLRRKETRFGWVEVRLSAVLLVEHCGCEQRCYLLLLRPT